MFYFFYLICDILLFVFWGFVKSFGFWFYIYCMSLRLSFNLVGEFGNLLVMFVIGIKEGDGGMYVKVLFSRCVVVGI